MEEQKERVSFRIDKKSESLNNVRVNKFGHTTTGADEKTDEIAVNLRLSGNSGVDAHVDIFDSPTMKKFMQQNNLNLNEQTESEIEIIDLSDDKDQMESLEIPEINNFARPDSLEEFDLIADEILGIAPTPKKIINEQPKSDLKNCQSCNCSNKPGSKFCSNCGKPFLMASFCKNCGNKFDNQEKFCSECGSKRE